MPVFLLFAVLLAWEGSQWLLPGLELDPVPLAWVSAAAFGVIAIGAACWRRAYLAGWDTGMLLGVWGALALGVPGVLLAVAQRYFAAEVAVAALAGVPVVMIVAAQVSAATEDGVGEALLPAVAGLAGALLLIPVRLPSSGNGWIGLGLDLTAVLLAGIFGLVGHRAAQAVGRVSAVFWVAAGNVTGLAALAGLLSLVRLERLATYAAPSLGVIAAVLSAEILTAIVLAVLLHDLQPLGFASRFLIVPLLGAVEAYVLLRPTLSFRALAGAVLMAVSAGLLLRVRPRGSESVVPARSPD